MHPLVWFAIIAGSIAGLFGTGFRVPLSTFLPWRRNK